MNCLVCSLLTFPARVFLCALFSFIWKDLRCLSWAQLSYTHVSGSPPFGCCPDPPDLRCLHRCGPDGRPDVLLFGNTRTVPLLPPLPAAAVHRYTVVFEVDAALVFATPGPASSGWGMETFWAPRGGGLGSGRLGS